MEYPHSYDWSAGRWTPVDVHAELLDATRPVPLNPAFEVSDGPGSDWVRTGRLAIAGRRLINDGNALQFTAALDPQTPVEAVLARQGVCPITVTLTPLYAVVPAIGVPTGAFAVKRQCTIRVSAPVRLETQVERVEFTEASIVRARLVYALPVSPATAEQARASIQIRSQTGRFAATTLPPDGEWAQVRFDPQPGAPFTSADQTILVTATVHNQTLTDRVTVPYALAGGIFVEVLPPTRITLNGSDSTRVRAYPVFSEPDRWDAAATAGVLSTFTIHLDSAGSTCLEPPAQATYEDQVAWTLTAKDAGRFPTPTSIPDRVVITIKGQIGSEPVEGNATLTLAADTDYDLRALVDGRDEATVLYDKKAAASGWGFPDIDLAFVRRGGRGPERVQFTHGQPTLVDEKGLLAFDVIQTGPEPTWRVRTTLKDPDLDHNPGTAWLEEDGIVRVTATVVQHGGGATEFCGTVQYRLRPQAEVVLFDATGGGSRARKEGHDYQGFAFQPLEFAADGTDRLVVGVEVRRTDWPEDDERTLTWVEFDPPTLSAPGSAEFDLAQGDGGTYTVKAERPLLRTPSRAGRRNLPVDLTGRLTAEAPPNYWPVVGVEKGQVLPRYPFLQLWVVPGRKRGRSTAAAAVGLDMPAREGRARETGPLPGLTLELDVRDPGQNLALAGGESPEKSTDGEGRCTWSLAYSGLTWQNIGQDKKVRCRFTGADEAVVFRIDIKENGARLFADLDSNRGALQLDNPEIQNWDNALLMAPPGCKGMFYNLRYSLIWAFSSTPIPENDPRSRYRCGHYSSRILTWLLDRRLGKTTAESALGMNGMECMQYGIAQAHDWSGVHLSGSGPNDDPLFIDPWWDQQWTGKVFGWKIEMGLAVAAVVAITCGFLLVCKFAIVVLRGVAPVSLRAVAAAVRDWLARIFVGMSPGVRNFLQLPSGSSVVKTATGFLGTLLAGIYAGSGAMVSRVDFDGFDAYAYLDESALIERLVTGSRAAGPVPPVRDWERWS